MSKKVFIGGAWPYANYNIHIGHLAALLPADAIARYYRQHGDQVIYASGTDCHGTPITQRALKEQVEPSEIAEKYHNSDVNDFRDLNFTYDSYGATYMDWHQKEVQDIFKNIYDNGYLYDKQVSQVYCEHCDKFLADREIGGKCPVCGADAKGDQCDTCLTSFDPQALKEKHCLICGGDITMKPNHELVFSLSRFQNQLQSYFEKNQGFWRANAVKETAKYLEQGLPDRDATRNLNWGIPVPFEGYEEKRIYVWFEAVLGYLTSGRQAAKNLGIDFDEFMKNSPDLKTYYVHGKDNIPFHTVIFPGLLLAMKKDIQLPKHIISSEYVNMNEEKMSKSKGNLITVRELIQSFSSDSIRFFFLMNNPEKKDMNFNTEDLVNTHNKILVGGFGNFVNRNLSFLKKKFNGVVPEGKVDSDIQKLTEQLYDTIGTKIESGDIRSAVEEMIHYIQGANKYYDNGKPWILVKEDPSAFADITTTCLYIMANMSNLFAPVIPDACLRLREILNLSAKETWNPVKIEKSLTLGECPVLYERILAN